MWPGSFAQRMWRKLVIQHETAVSRRSRRQWMNLAWGNSAARRPRYAKQVQGVGVVGLGAEDAAVAPDGLGQQSALVFLQADGKLVVHGDSLSKFHAAKSGRWCESEGGIRQS